MSPWLRTLGGNGTTYSKHMEGARFTIPTPAPLARVVDAPDEKMVRAHAEQGGFPANCVSEVKSMIDPTTAE